jgi:predicted chitinase
MVNVSIDSFIQEYRKIWPIQQIHEDSLRQLLVYIKNDPLFIDSRHVAYFLASIRHETAMSYMPIDEIGHGAGHPYGTPDPVTHQTYWGRGYLQITWRDNYARFGALSGVDLLNFPELALDQKVSYEISSTGFLHGMFTGVSIHRYIHDDVCDYVSARRVINGLDQAAKIAGYAEKFGAILS